jgi:hypothetical protein
MGTARPALGLRAAVGMPAPVAVTAQPTGVSLALTRLDPMAAGASLARLQHP